jgi:hypothetical protein
MPHCEVDRMRESGTSSDMPRKLQTRRPGVRPKTQDKRGLWKQEAVPILYKINWKSKKVWYSASLAQKGRDL